MRTKVKYVLSTIVISVSLLVLCFFLLAIHSRPHFVEQPISVRFLKQLHEASSLTNAWANNPKEVALRLVGTDLFPPGRPQETDLATASLESISSDRCIVDISEGFMDNQSNALIATWDRISLQREGDVWLPFHREVSWQTKNRPGWRNDPLQ